MGICGTILLLFIFLPIPLWIMIEVNINYYYDFLETKFKPHLPAEYDFIIVGAGSAGSVLANRLSRHNKVLVIEAGGDPLSLQRIPAFVSPILNCEGVKWDYRTVPQTFSSFSMENQVSLWPRGKSLGGSSSLNGMLYVRGSPQDYDNWANLTGDPGWNFENILPFFKKSIIYKGRYQNNKHHYGNDQSGQLYISTAGFLGLDAQLSPAFQELGLKIQDVNGPQISGTMDQVEFFQKDGSRWDSYTGFIKPILYRSNLYISRYSHALKVDLDSNNRATGVWFKKNGVKSFAKARKEIILSAGTIDSPKLLMLSGIGPKDDLVSKKIRPRVDLPVGKNLMDHLMVFIPNVIIGSSISYSPLRDFGIHEVFNYLVHGKGMLATPLMFTHQAFVSSSLAESSWADIQLYAFAVSQHPGMAQDFSKLFGIQYATLEKLMGSVEGIDTATFAAALVRPKSIGSLTLRDKNPESLPIIDPRYLENPDDVKILREAIEWVLKLIYNTTAFQKLEAHIPQVPLIGCEAEEFGSALYWDCYVRHLASTLYHPVGTCKMGRVDDTTTVVDTSLRVLQTVGLRVIDASIMPVIVNGNTAAPVTMIGEKGAYMIREYWSHQYLVCPQPSRYYTIQSPAKCHYSRQV